MPALSVRLLRQTRLHKTEGARRLAVAMRSDLLLSHSKKRVQRLLHLGPPRLSRHYVTARTLWPIVRMFQMSVRAVRGVFGRIKLKECGTSYGVNLGMHGVNVSEKRPHSAIADLGGFAE